MKISNRGNLHLNRTRTATLGSIPLLVLLLTLQVTTAHATTQTSSNYFPCNGTVQALGEYKGYPLYATCTRSTGIESATRVGTIGLLVKPDDTIVYNYYTVSYWYGDKSDPWWSFTDQAVLVIDTTTHSWYGSPAPADYSPSSLWPYSIALDSNTAAQIGSYWHWYTTTTVSVYGLGPSWLTPTAQSTDI